MPNQQNNFYSGQQRSSYKDSGSNEAPELPKIHPLLIDGRLNPDNYQEKLLSDIAKSIGKVTATQMRRVFDEIKRFDFILQSGKSWEDIFPLVLMQKAKISYICKRKSEKDRTNKSYYANLKKLIFSLIDQCHSEKEYHAYVAFMEALYGFYYEIAPKN